MLTIIRNAQAVKKESVSVPFSKFKMNLAEVLVKEGYIKSVSRRGKKNKKFLSIWLKYDNDGSPAVKHIKRISKPSKRIYLGLRRIFPVQYNSGIHILSTPKGILTNKEAKSQKVGGEVICEIW